MKKAPFLFPAALAAALVFAPVFLSSCATAGTARAEECYSIGLAYYELGNFAEAEKWLNRARALDKTLTASEYNLGRIAFETGRYEEAARHFESILALDGENVMALKSAAYSRIKNGDFEEAEALYARVLVLVPESADDGFNYALVLYGIEKYGECEKVLNKYPAALEENADSLLLLARAQKAQNKIEAVDTWAKWAALAENAGAAELYEYALSLETAGLYARAVEQYDKALAVEDDTGGPQKHFLRFEKARVLLAADPEDRAGMEELDAAIAEGFSDAAAVAALLDNESLPEESRDAIKSIHDRLLIPVEVPEAVPAQLPETAAEPGPEPVQAEETPENTGNPLP